MAVALLLVREPPLPRGDQGAPFTHGCLPLLEHKTEKWCLPPTFQSHTNTFHSQSQSNTSRQEHLQAFIPLYHVEETMEKQERGPVLTSNTRQRGLKQLFLYTRCCYFSIIKMMMYIMQFKNGQFKK